MKINLDYLKIADIARRTGTSPHYQIKKIIKYRKCQNKEMDCRFCENHRIIGIEKKIKQCEIIGINAVDYYAKVDKDHICNNYERMKTKINCETDHNCIKYLPFIQEEIKNEC